MILLERETDGSIERERKKERRDTFSTRENSPICETGNIVESR